GKIVQPTIGLITNAAAAHLEGLKTVEGVAKAKGELLDFIAPNGTAILNRDDDFYADWLGRSTDRSSALNVQSFGRHPDADIRITAAELNRVTLSIHGQETQFECALLGAHNQLNIAASVAVAVVAGVEIEAIKTGLQNVQAVDGRLALCQAKNQNITLINDSYNANAASMRAAIDVLAASKGQTVLVLGAMGELGAESASIHQALAQYAKASDIDYLFTLVNQHGENYLQDMAAYLMGFGAQSQSFKTVQALQEKITNIAKTSTTVLIKGSRFCQMENVVQALSLKEATPC
ncbi:MAG: UDP-N-acetylmuramoyl-tripeptide--D-alanyl-D-alanine ligase, partial [Arenicellales bacterium]